MNLLTPGANKRLNELFGFLWFVAALLLVLVLASYDPLDPSLNTAAPALADDSFAPDSGAQNWVGLVGAYTADLLWQALGYAALLLPLTAFLLAWKWFRSRPVESPKAKLIAALLLGFSFSALLGLLPALPRIHGLIPASGLLGILLASGLVAVVNVPGAFIFSLTGLIVGTYLATTFSLAATYSWLNQKTGFVQAVRARWEQGIAFSWPWKQKQAALVVSGRLQRASRAVDISAPPELSAPADARAPAPGARSKVIPISPPSEPEAPRSGPRPKTAPPVMRPRYRLPLASLLRAPEHLGGPNERELQERAALLTQKFEEFDVKGQVVQINPGPVVTTFEFRPEAGIKLSRVTALADDLCLALKAESILIERIPGKSTVGIEVPNLHRETIVLREIIESPEFASSTHKLTVALGKDLHGAMRVTDLGQMPHLLIAGSTGSGKSVAINAMIISMLYKAAPEEVNFILIDPKRLELGLYEGIPHLFTPIVTDPKLAANALRNATREMEKRLKLLAASGVRNVEQYNRLYADDDVPSLITDGEEAPRSLPYIVIVIDELADLMMVDTPNVEESVTRLAQLARAVGIHLILSTQRPSVDVITGLIKANFPARISFRVATKVDSRTILDANGAEALLGKGDMLYLPAGSARLHRLHGPLVTESEIVHVCDFWRSQAKPTYHEEFLRFPKDMKKDAPEEDDTLEVDDELYEQAVRVVMEQGKASTSTLQRRLRVGYGRAARLIDMMEAEGLVGPPDGSKPREVIKKRDFSHV